MSAFEHYAQPLRQRLERVLAQRVPATPGSLLGEAMRYSLTGPGKRIRPLLVYASYAAVGGDDHPALDQVACAVEALHAYSLIHDDLPAMDNDDLRRGRPTCHIKYDPALAILAGDALQTLAFELLANAPELDDSQRLALIRVLCSASGSQGMVVGQAIDLAAVATRPSFAELEHMHRCKTGALIDAAVRLGAIIGEASQVQTQALAEYSQALGLAFQVQDDILDVTANTETLGKQQGADIARDKPTYVSFLGLDAARDLAQQLSTQALAALAELPGDTAALESLASFVVTRGY